MINKAIKEQKLKTDIRRLLKFFNSNDLKDIKRILEETIKENRRK
jgi:hypothetical protein